MSAKKLLNKARKGGYAIGAFNAANLETLKAIFGAAKKLHSPVIIESSGGETAYIGECNLRSMVSNMSAESGVPALVNLDHSHSDAAVKRALLAEYDLLHFDGSKLSVATNKKHLKKLAPLVHKAGKLLEGEMDHITGSSSPHMNKDVTSEQDESMYTDPVKAAKFIEDTGIDILAVFIGNVHGVYKNAPKLDLKRLEQIKQHTNAYLSLHGGSGIQAKDVKKAVAMGGIVKVNVNTELRIAFRDSLEKALKKSDEVAIYKLMPEVIAAVQKVVESKIRMFGSMHRL